MTAPPINVLASLATLAPPAMQQPLQPKLPPLSMAAPPPAAPTPALWRVSTGSVWKSLAATLVPAAQATQAMPAALHQRLLEPQLQTGPALGASMGPASRLPTARMNTSAIARQGTPIGTVELSQV